MKFELLFSVLASSIALAVPITECPGGQQVTLQNTVICISPIESDVCPENDSQVLLADTYYCVSVLSNNIAQVPSSNVTSSNAIIPVESEACVNNTLRVHDSNLNPGKCVQMDKMVSRNFKIYNDFNSSWLQAKTNENLAFGERGSVVVISGFKDGNRLYFLSSKNYICLPANGQDQTPRETCFDQTKTIRATRAGNGEWFYLSDNSLDESTLKPKKCLSTDWGTTGKDYWKDCNENDQSQQFKLVE